MIGEGESSGLMVNREWYVAPAYNYLLQHGVKKFEVGEFWNTGTPKDLDAYIEAKVYNSDETWKEEL